MKKILFLLFATLGVSAFGQQIGYTNSKILQTAVNNDRAGVYNVLDYGADPTGVVDATTAIRNACNAAYTTGGKVIGTGTFLISDSILIRSNADFSGATFNINDDAKTAVTFTGTGVAQYFRTVFFPVVIQTKTRTSGVWSGNDIGVKIINAYSCTFFVPYISNFSTGLLVSTSGAEGVQFNSFHLGMIDGAKICLKLSPGSTSGWVNDNGFYDGSLTAWTADGTGVAGTRAILIDSTLVNELNSNIFMKVGLEGNLWEYNVECWGLYNMFIGCRWESTTPKFKYSDKSVSNYAAKNMVVGGYNSEAIVFTVGTYSYGNSLLTWESQKLSTVTSGFSGNNVYSDNSPVFSVVPASVSLLTSTIGTSYTWAAGANYMITKGTADTNPQFQITNANGMLSWGNGSGSPDLSLSRHYGSVFKITSPLTFADNAAALTGGLTAGDIYRTSTGVLMVVY